MRFQSDRVCPSHLGIACIATKNWREVKKDFVLESASHRIGRKKIILTLKQRLGKVRRIPQKVAHMILISGHINYTTRIYRYTTRIYGRDYKGEIVAIAINPAGSPPFVGDMDSLTQYFCLEGIWKEDKKGTSIVSPDKLQRLLVEALDPAKLADPLGAMDFYRGGKMKLYINALAKAAISEDCNRFFFDSMLKKIG